MRQRNLTAAVYLVLVPLGWIGTVPNSAYALFGTVVHGLCVNGPPARKQKIGKRTTRYAFAKCILELPHCEYRYSLNISLRRQYM